MEQFKKVLSKGKKNDGELPAFNIAVYDNDSRSTTNEIEIMFSSSSSSSLSLSGSSKKNRKEMVLIEVINMPIILNDN
ncbi:unnamed protein product [Cunninghamella blakesleeana]